MNIHTLLGIKYPIIGGAMAGITKAEFVAAISNAGGLGILAGGGLTRKELAEEIRKCKKLTSSPFGVNIMLKAENKDEIAQLLVEEKVSVVTTGAGNPEPYIAMWKQAGMKVIPVIASVKHAKKMELLEVDAVIAEGTEAGGHIGSTTTMCLVPQIADAISIPVIAAGGIADGRGMLAAESLGASGVQIGTRFLATYECPIASSYKEKMIASDDTDTIVTGTVRGLKNRLTEEYRRLEKLGKQEELESLTTGSLKKAILGDVELGSMMAGQISGMIHEIKSVEEVITEIMQQYLVKKSNICLKM